MNLVIDQGNTFNKLGVFDKEQLIHSYSEKILDKKTMANLLMNYSISNVIVSSVQYYFDNISEAKEVLHIPQELNVLVLSAETQVPISNSYKTPKTLGRDRLAALVGASLSDIGCPKLVIDAGTAITIDYLDENNNFKGGNISPGIQTRFKSLKQNTKHLPLLECNSESPFLGLSTNEAIWSGVQNSVIYEIDGYINHFNQLNPSTKTFFTGGDVDFFANNLKNRIFVHQNLVLTGLNAILEHNV